MRQSSFLVFAISIFAISIFTNCSNQPPPCFGLCTPNAANGCPCIEGPIHYGSDVGHQKSGLFGNNGGRKVNNSLNNCDAQINSNNNEVELIFTGHIDNACQTSIDASSLKVNINLTDLDNKMSVPFNVTTTFAHKSNLQNSPIILFAESDFTEQVNTGFVCRIWFTSTLTFQGQASGNYGYPFRNNGT